MADIFYVRLVGKDGAEAFLNLPATPWELLDVREKLRLKDGELPRATVEESYRFDFLERVLDGEHNLYDLNALARKLSGLDEHQTAEAPDYTILLELEDGARLGLPAECLPSILPVRCLDCKVPSLTDLISHCEDDLQDLNRFAQALAEMEPEDFTAYKALLEAVDCQDLDSAQQLADTLEDYIFSPQYRSPTDVAKGELSIILSQRDADQIAPYLDLPQYGQSLLQRDGDALTSYGLITRKDGQNIQECYRSRDAPEWGGMTMQ